MRIALLLLTVVLTGCASTPQTEQTQATTPVAVLENVIRWATASEVDNFGYDVFRSLDEDGPFERVNELPIPGHGTTDEPQYYAFRDTTIAPDTAYFYYVESISLQGERERFTPIFRSNPKPAPR